MNNLISIIVPVYRVEEFLARCVESILLQDYQNFELILVDDGSPDQCGTICDEYLRKDKRIKVIHKENGGLSDARNSGLAIAKGDFIAFVDSDDWIASDYLSCMLGVLNLTGADICECEILKTSHTYEETPTCKLDIKECDTEDALKELICDDVFHQYVWNKLYKRECIGNISFPIGKLNEDEFWTYRVFANANKIVKINKVLYYYFQREGSIMGAKYNLRRLDTLDAKMERQDYMDKHYPKLKSISKINLFATCIYNGQMTLKYLEGTERREAISKIDLIQKNSSPKKNELDFLLGSQKKWIQMARWNFWITCRIKIIFGKGF